MFGLATELITKGKLATVKRVHNKAFTHCYYTVRQKTRTRNIVRCFYNDY